MPIHYDVNSLLTRMVWTSSSFASGGATTNLAWIGSPMDTTKALDTVAAIADNWTTYLKPEQDTDIRLDEIQWETDDESGGVAVGANGDESIAGPPPNSTLLVTYRSTTKGRRGRGRGYWPGFIAETNVDERGIITEARVLALQTAFDAFLEGVATDASVTQAIAQSDNPGQTSEPLSPWPAVAGWTVQSLMATQRRRLRK